MPADLDPRDVAEVRRRVVGPVARSLIRDDEFEDVVVEIDRDRLGGFWTGDGLRVAVKARGELLTLTSRWYLPEQPDERWDAEGFAAEVYGLLQDEVAESRFGWGELRSGHYDVLPRLSPPTG